MCAMFIVHRFRGFRTDFVGLLSNSIDHNDRSAPAWCERASFWCETCAVWLCVRGMTGAGDTFERAVFRGKTVILP